MKNLTKRELEVMELVVKGLNNKEIGEILHISFHTVKAELANIFYKLKVANRIQAVVIFLKDKYKFEELENN